MSRTAPGSHVLISAALLFALIPISFLSLWHTRSREFELEDALHQDLMVLRQLPEMRSSVRRIDLLTELYLSSPRKDVLVRHDAAADAIRRRRDELRVLCVPAALSGACDGFERRLGAFLSADDSALRSREFEKTRRARRNDLLDSLSSVSDAASAELMRRLDAAQAALLRAALLRVLLESAAAVILVSCLYVFVLRPIGLMDEATRLWRLGDQWTAPTGRSIVELRNLGKKFEELTHRMNGQFKKERALSEFKTGLISVVSHEFGNSLAIIQSAAFLIQESLAADAGAETAPYFDMIRANIVSLSGDALNVLTVSRAESGRLAADFKPVDIGGVLKSAVERMRLLAERKKLKLTIELPSAATWARADSPALSLAVSNLLSNAIKYTPPRGRVSAGILLDRKQAGYVRVYVRDTGIGFTEREKELILRGHFRTERGRRMTSRGFGLGLALTRQIVEAHGCALDVESRPDVGSEFSFALRAEADGPPGETDRRSA